MLLFFSLLFCHFLFDYPMQGEFLSKAKNPFNSIHGIPWVWPMSAHAFMHAFAVFMIIGIWWIALLEFISHFTIDYYKCKGEFDFVTDQILHIILKIVWIALAIMVV